MPNKSTALSTIPLLGPGADILEDLLTYPRAALRDACDKRGIEWARGWNRAQLADALVRNLIRARAEEHYTDNDKAFIPFDDENPVLVRILAERGYKHIVEVGCGTGLMAELFRPSLAPDARWFGFDIITAAIARARARLAHDSRFTFEVGDAESIRPPTSVDCVFMAWLIPWLNTHSVYRMVRRLAQLCPQADLVCAVPFLPTVRRMEGMPPPSQDEIEAAHAYLEGRASNARERWDLRRFELAHAAVEESYEVSATHVIGTAHVAWVGRSRRGAG